MQEIDVFDVEDALGYEIVAFGRGEKSIHYDFTMGACPDELGGWWMITKRDSSFAIYRGEEGCPYCGTDAFDNWSKTIEGPITRDKATRFVEEEGYESVADIPLETMRQHLGERTIGALLPQGLFRTDNHWDGWPDRDQAAAAITKAVIVEMGWPDPRRKSVGQPTTRAESGTGMRIGHPVVKSLIKVLRNFTIGALAIAWLIAIVMFIDLRWWTVLLSLVLGIVGLVGLLMSRSTLLDLIGDMRSPVRVQGIARKIIPAATPGNDGNSQFVVAEQTFTVEPSIWKWISDGDLIFLHHWPRNERVVYIEKIH